MRNVAREVTQLSWRLAEGDERALLVGVHALAAVSCSGGSLLWVSTQLGWMRLASRVVCAEQCAFGYCVRWVACRLAKSIEPCCVR